MKYHRTGLSENTSLSLVFNRGRVHIDCVDSTTLLDSEDAVERQLLLSTIIGGYLDWSRSLGYEWAHMRIPPPTDSNAYIFMPRSFPVRQKIALHMSKWYDRVMNGAKSCGIVHWFTATADLNKADFPWSILSPMELDSEGRFGWVIPTD
jgi:hypothetical protein